MADIPEDQIEPSLSEIIVSRFAHELVGPIGAISNGMELMSSLGEDAGADIIDLVTRSAKAANARLAFFRIAYGRAGSTLAGIADVKGIAETFFDQLPRHSLSWRVSPSRQSFDMYEARLVLLLCEVALDMTPRGGDIFVDLSDVEFSVTGTGEGAKIHEKIAKELTEELGCEDVGADIVHAVLARQLAERLGQTIQIHAEGERVQLKSGILSE